MSHVRDIQSTNIPLMYPLIETKLIVAINPTVIQLLPDIVIDTTDVKHFTTVNPKHTHSNNKMSYNRPRI